MFSLEEVEETLPAAEMDATEKMAAAQATRDFIMTKINAPIDLHRSEISGEVADGVEWDMPLPFPPNVSLQDSANTRAFVSAFGRDFIVFVGNGTLEYHEASVVYPRLTTENLQTLYDDYDVAVYVDRMADCLQGLMNLAASFFPENGLRISTSLRFGKKEDGLLSMSHDKPIVSFNIPDYIYYNQEYIVGKRIGHFRDAFLLQAKGQ